MTSRSKSWRLGPLALGAVFVIAGCGPSDGDPKATSSPTSSGVATDVPAGYDPCNDIPQSVLDSEKLHRKEKDDSTASGGIRWRGCAWVQSDGYAASIQTTNITIDMARAKKFPDTQEFTISGRRAISTRQVDTHPESVCTVDVEMKGGSLEFNLTNPPSSRNTGNLNTCDLTRALAEKVVPTVPAAA
ncbi:DUF3558 domain-containing protein [Nocardia altamirensis]|uniref:DUF3558 domain-containing protein n=1 Tax=Nocardia altamirensis TaxID=472158 RepID=UPI00114CB31F|nr:DUF3558 domain-containing protein [Nocardia altamirensis]